MSLEIPLKRFAKTTVGSVINGTLNMSSDWEIKEVEIFKKGSKDPINIIVPTMVSGKAEFSTTISDANRQGNYEAIWNVVIDGKDDKIVSKFSIADEMDDTLPMDMQGLGK